MKKIRMWLSIVHLICSIVLLFVALFVQYGFILILFALLCYSYTIYDIYCLNTKQFDLKYNSAGIVKNIALMLLFPLVLTALRMGREIKYLTIEEWVSLSMIATTFVIDWVIDAKISKSKQENE